MSIGRHACHTANRTDLKAAIAIGLDDGFTALDEAFGDLSDEQAAGFPIAGRNNIAWIVMHCLDNLDEYAVSCPTGQRVYAGEWRWDLWQCRPDERPKPGDTFPTVADMLDRLHAIRDRAEQALRDLDAERLNAPFSYHPNKSTLVDFYMRTIWHTAAHTRQIWALRGVMGLVGSPRAWPQQHWA